MNKSTQLNKKKLIGLSASYNIGGADLILHSIINHFENATAILNSNLINKTNFNKETHYLPFRSLNKNVKSILSFTSKYLITLFKINGIIQNDNIILCNDLLALIYCFPFKLMGKTQIIFYCHSAFKQTFFNQIVLSPFINFFSQRIIVPSNFLKNELILLGVNSHKIRMIYNGIATYEIQKTSAINSDEILRIGIFGGIINQKGQDTLIDAVNFLVKNGMQIRCFVIGNIYDTGYYNKLLNKVKESNGNIEFTGFKPHRDAQQLMSELDIVVCVSKFRETLPTVLLEALSCKKAVIGTRVGGIPEIIQDGVNGFLTEPDNHLALAEAIKKLSNFQIRNKMGVEGFRIFNERFSQDQYFSNLEKEISEFYTA